jgi:hypothetical protein
MAGKYSGVQARILQLNPEARYNQTVKLLQYIVLPYHHGHLSKPQMRIQLQEMRSEK